MIFYHGGASRPVLKNIREKCPSLTHGNGYTPDYFYEREHPYFLDNGAFTDGFNSEEWRKMIKAAEKFENKPDFIVLPDKFNNPKKTFKRSREHIEYVKNFNYYYAAQKPQSPKDALEKALSLKSDGIFIGGEDDWKKRNAKKIVKLAHKNDMKAHIGMPGDYYWAYKTDADSMDSVTVARHEDYERIESLENAIKQQTNISRW